ncbi:MAG: glycosyltransferase family 4 protein [Candidatus Diapherotrites archaeon]|nr:glycosyltransferase family 4 protein [Candidatus Diapherotrites archaeon]
MNILMLGWEFPPLKTGGLGIHCYHVTKNLHAKNHHITFFIPRSSMDMHVDFVDIVQIPGCTLDPYVKMNSACNQVGENFAPGIDYFTESKKYADRVLEKASEKKFDVVHCHDWMTFEAGVKIKKKMKKPLVFTVHSTEFNRSGETYPNHKVYEIERKSMQEADAIIAVSNAVKDTLVNKYGIDHKKIRVIYNAVDHERFFKQQKNTMITCPTALFLGRLTIQKGAVFFLEAARKVAMKIPEAKFIIAGTGELFPELIQKSIDLGISKNVIFTGFVDDKLLAEVYKSADVYVMPSISEPFGITALEAMASKVPVIISKQSGVSEVITHCMKVDFWDTDKLADRMYGILKYASLKKTMACHGEFESRKFSWFDVAGQTEQVYARVLND